MSDRGAERIGNAYYESPWKYQGEPILESNRKDRTWDIRLEGEKPEDHWPFRPAQSLAGGRSVVSGHAETTQRCPWQPRRSQSAGFRQGGILSGPCSKVNKVQRMDSVSTCPGQNIICLEYLIWWISCQKNRLFQSVWITWDLPNNMLKTQALFRGMKHFLTCN